jgi:hypothetical protein
MGAPGLAATWGSDGRGDSALSLPSDHTPDECGAASTVAGTLYPGSLTRQVAARVREAAGAPRPGRVLCLCWPRTSTRS